MTRPAFPFAQGPAAAPPPEYPRLVEHGGLAPVRLSSGVDACLATRYDDVRQILADPRFSRAAYAGRGLFARERDSLALVTSDAPGHTRRRAAIARAFTARRAEELRPELTTLAEELLDRMRAAGPPADLVAAFAVPFPLTVMCRLLGVPAEDGVKLLPWAEAMMSTSRHEPEVVADAHERMHGYFAELLDAEPTGLLGELRDDESLSRQEAVVLGAGLLIAGHETTCNQLATCAYLLLTEPGLAEELQRRPERVIEEMLRWTPFTSTGGIAHVATEDVELPGGVVRAGEVVVPVTDAANRDPGVFARPAVLDPERPPRAHLAFGHGRHHCPGAPLARTELQVGLAALVRLLPGLTLAVRPGELSWRRGMFIRGLWTLPVRWCPEETA